MAGGSRVTAAPSVAVVVPTRGRRGYLERALRSALGQTYENVREIVVVVDGDDDATVQRVRALAGDRLDVIVNRERLGPGASRNTGIEATSADLISFLDDDDVWAPTKLTRQVAALRRRTSSGWSCAG